MEKLNQDGQVLWHDVMKLDEVVKLNPDEESARSKAEPWFKPKPRSVFPKRRSVKRMMFDHMVQSVVPISHPAGCPSSSRASQSKPQKSKRRSVKRMMFDHMVQSVARKSKTIYPKPA
ncbi:hypothetical protein CJ030_MR7G015276 [Morella rubra]|uniref:Uncharacterized protein n=1 Tax=Morella rubra TaxID=262757 RepID=A0A6A1V0P0_9ROSI|nr:hypothetical protein CJ030_MR7G015276 [Morella rubra]